MVRCFYSIPNNSPAHVRQHSVSARPLADPMVYIMAQVLSLTSSQFKSVVIG